MQLYLIRNSLSKSTFVYQVDFHYDILLYFFVYTVGFSQEFQNCRIFSRVSKLTLFVSSVGLSVAVLSLIRFNLK